LNNGERRFEAKHLAPRTEFELWLTTLKAAAVRFDSSAAKFEHVSIVGQKVGGLPYESNVIAIAE
jgi:hypothetical protein